MENKQNQLTIQSSYVGKIVFFERETGCIPAGSVCYCYQPSDDRDFIWVNFKHPILGRNAIKLHIKVLLKHGKIIDEV